MARSRETKIELTAYDDLFQTDESREEAKLSKIRDIPISEIDEFPDHPFKVLMDEDMEQLVESIKRNGVMTPATVRLKEDGRYELISGHRRKKAFGVSAYPLNGAERLQIMYETFNQNVKVPFKFSYDDMLRTGLNTKDYIAPSSFLFKNGKDFQMGDTIGAVSYLQILAPELTDKMLAEFLEMDCNLLVNLHIQWSSMNQQRKKGLLLKKKQIDFAENENPIVSI